MKLIIILFLTTISVFPTTIRHMSFEEQCSRSDLVAYAEVTVAGGIYAKYKILKSYKGPEKGEFIIKTQPGPHAPYFPSVYVGDKYFIMASKTNLTQLNSTSSGGNNVMAWRRIKHDYKFPLWQGKLYIDNPDEIKKLETRAKAFLQKPEKLKKIYFLKEACSKLLGSMDSRRGRVNIAAKSFLLSKSREDILKAYNFLTEEERNYLRLYELEDEEAVLEYPKVFTEDNESNRFDELSILPETEFIAKWEKIKQDKKDSELFVKMTECEDWAGFLLTGKYQRSSSIRLSMDNIPDDLFKLSYWLQHLRESGKELDDSTIQKVYEKIISKMTESDSIYGIYEILKINLPENKEPLLKQLKGLSGLANIHVKNGLLLLLGDKPSLEAVVKQFKNQQKQLDDYDSYNLCFPLYALLNTNKSKFLQLKDNKILRPKLAEVLLWERRYFKSKSNIKTIDEILQNLNSEELFDVYRQGYQRSFINDFPAHYKRLPLDERVEDSFDFIRDGQKPNPVLVQELMSYSGSDERTIIMSIFYLASSASPEMLKFYQKHQKIIDKNKYAVNLARSYCHKLNEKDLLLLLKKNYSLFNLMAANYLVIKSEKHLESLKLFLKSQNPTNRLQAAVNLAERGMEEAIDVLFKIDVDKIDHETRDNRIFKTYMLGRIHTYFSNMSKGKTNEMEWDELKQYWSQNRKSFRCPWRIVLDKAGYE